MTDAGPPKAVKALALTNVIIGATWLVAAVAYSCVATVGIYLSLDWPIDIPTSIGAGVFLFLGAAAFGLAARGAWLGKWRSYQLILAFLSIPTSCPTLLYTCLAIWVCVLDPESRRFFETGSND